MIQKFLRSRARRTALPAAIPDGERVYAIGDIHGCADQLDTLLAAIDRDDRARGPSRTTIVILGDVVDRGPASAAVVDRLRKLSSERNVRLLKGNHEEIFLAACDGDEKALRLFCRIGGRETILSYRLDAAAYERMDYHELASRIGDIVPADHRTFLSAFEDLIIIGDYAFVHAGIHPGRSIADQRPTDLRWIRDTFLDHPNPFEKRIVHGHTVTDDVEYRPNRIGIDTGAYASGVLSALGLEGSATWTLQTAASP